MRHYIALLETALHHGLSRWYADSLTRWNKSTLGNIPESQPFAWLMQETYTMVFLPGQAASSEVDDWEPTGSLWWWWDGNHLHRLAADDIKAKLADPRYAVGPEVSYTARDPRGNTRTP